MRHQPNDIPSATTKPRDIVARAVRISSVGNGAVFFAVAKDDAIFSLQLGKRVVVADVVAFRVRDRNTKHGAARQLVSKRTVNSFYTNINVFADEVQIAIANQSARQQPGFAENLKSIADTEHEATAVRKLLHRIHHGREACEGAGAQVVAVRKAAGKYYRVVSRKIGFAVPDEIYWLAHVLGNDVVGVVVAIRTGKNNNSEFHASISTR